MRKMKTKMLFSAAMMTALFAACTNEDFVDNSQKFDTSNEGRIAVENVALNFVKGESVDTRLDFDPSTGHWSWEGNETIGALLMDEVWGTAAGYMPYANPKEWAELTWLEKYQLANEIHTDYPFTYDGDKAEWVCNAKMLEGNYFFAYPFNNYDGRRQAIHYLNNQVQEGSSEAAMADAFAKNQFWVGYAQIKESESEAYDKIKDVYMTHVLAPIRLDISTIGTQTYHINKIQVKGTGLTSAVYLDPTNADYNGSVEGKTGDYNLKSGNAWVNDNDKYFNYANFLGLETDLYDHTTTDPEQADYVWNIDDEENYVKGDALRAIVKPLLSTGENTYSELVINNAKELKEGGEHVYATIYVTPIGKLDNDGQGDDDNVLTLSIFTDEGVVRDIDLTVINEEINGGAQDNTAITNKAIENLTPTTSNLIEVQIDDNSFNQTARLDIYNEDDLKQFITWNQKQNRAYTATLKNNVTLSWDLQKMLVAAKEANKDNKLIVKAESSQVLSIAPGEANIFNYIDVAGVDVEVQGNFIINSDKVVALPTSGKKITIAAVDEDKTIGGGLAMQKYDLSDVLVVENYNVFSMEAGYVAKNIQLTNKKGGLVGISGDLTFADNSKNEAEATVAVYEGGILRGTTNGNLENEGTIQNVGGKMYNIVNNDVKTALVITSGEEGAVNHFNSNGAAATIKLSTLEDELSGNYAGGHIKFETNANVDASDLAEVGVTDLVINSAELRLDAPQNNAIALKTIEGTNATLVGGIYVAEVWTPGTWTRLTLASGAEITLSGTTTLNAIHLPEGDVEILSGTVAVSNNVYFASDATTGNAVKLGSTEGFTKNSVTINIARNAKFVAGQLTEEPGTNNRINNNGACYVSNDNYWDATKVSGNEVENIATNN